MSYWNSDGNRASAPNVYSRRSSVGDAPEKHVTRLEFRCPGFIRKKYRVLLAHDLSVRSEIAFVRAARLTLERKGHLTVLHVINSELPAPVIEAQRVHAESYLEAEVRRWLAHHRIHAARGAGESNAVRARWPREPARRRSDGRRVRSSKHLSRRHGRLRRGGGTCHRHHRSDVSSR